MQKGRLLFQTREQIPTNIAHSLRAYGPSATVTPNQIIARNERLAEDSQRVGAFYDAQEREREARNAREASAAQEYEISPSAIAGRGADNYQSGHADLYFCRS